MKKVKLKLAKMCRHNFANLIAKKGKKLIEIKGAKICLKCGLLKIGKKTVRMTQDTLDMGGGEIKNIGYLKIPVGTDRYK